MVILEEDDIAGHRRAKERELSDLGKSDRKCSSQIIQKIADSYLEYVNDKGNAFQA